MPRFAIAWHRSRKTRTASSHGSPVISAGETNHLPIPAPEGFQTLLLFIGLVILGVAIKGFFMFLQEVLVADVMQLTLFDIRNLFFRRTINLDLASFSDQGSAELMARFTNDMDSFGQGLITLMSKLIREPMRVAMCLWCALAQLATDLPHLVVVPISALTTCASAGS